jgi:hypothetical protein
LDLRGRKKEDAGENCIANEEPHMLYSSPYIARVMRSKRIRWARHVTRNEYRRQHTHTHTHNSCR